MVRKLLCLAGALLLLVAVPVTASAETESLEPYLRRMVSYYRYYQERADAQIDTLLAYIRSRDAKQGNVWSEIMDRWSWVNSEMEVQEEILPDGLPEDDSLCIVVLGYGLNTDGSMQRELVERLQVGLASAEKYPNAYVLCTGGETAANAPGVSEAGQMGQWLLKNGLDRERLILETDSLNTAQNALNSFKILEREYPQVSSIAVVTSDYHIRWGCAMFTTASIWGQSEGGSGYALVGNAVCDTALDGYDSMYYQAWGISYITGIGLDNSGKPVLE